MIDIEKERIKEDGMKLIEEFSEMLSKIPQSDEVHYVIDIKNITRQDTENDTGNSDKSKFKDAFEKNAPHYEEDYIIAEKAT